MAGRYPKPESQRRNRTKPAVDWVVLPRDGRTAPAPALPSVRIWSNSVIDWWNELWSTPQATQWQTTDPELYRLAMLQASVWKPGASKAPGFASMLAEMRAIEDRHGLTPKAMLQLRWMIADDDGAETPSQPSSARRQARRDRILRVVQDPPEEPETPASDD